MIKKINLLLLFIIASITLRAQAPKLNSLHGNAQIIEYRKNLPKQNNTHLTNRTQSTSATSLLLPFYDEFSYQGPYPDSTKWLNSQSVFVNHTKAIAPPTLGVATFDGLDKYGYPYNSAVTYTANSYVSSDTLTSMPIRLDSSGSIGYSPLDSMYLSFYYEGRGYWDKPEQGDVLSLEFYSPSDGIWNPIWSHGGYLYDPDSTWHLVMIPITDTSYFHKNFQFRFSNLSSGSGDVDHWHLDVISLKPSAYNDTIFGDFTFAYDLPSALKNYSQMPYRQYAGATDMKTNIGTYLRNNFDDIGHQNVGTYYSFYDKTGTVLYNYSNGRADLGYYYSVGYCNSTLSDSPLNGFFYPTSTDTNTFSMKFYLDQASDNNYGNDTISFKQTFSNYYAYDDGSAEAGFGIGSDNGSGNYQTASRFTLNNADTLRAVDIFFDPIADVDLIKTAPFNILILTDNAAAPGTPGNVIYTDSSRYAYFPPDTVVPGTQPRENHFSRYQLKAPIMLGAGTTFYIVLAATFPNPQINVGFDMNTDFHHNMFYNADGVNWYVFPGDLDPDYRGSLMVRPVFGDSLETLSIKDYASKNKASFTLYPNPAQDYVAIQSESNIAKIVVTDLLGNIILQQTASSIKTINTLSLQSGVYLIKAFTDKGFADTQKLIITR